MLLTLCVAMPALPQGWSAGIAIFQTFYAMQPRIDLLIMQES
jgi:hypothetical protein